MIKHLKTRHVLIVDDDMDTRATLHRFVRQMSHTEDGLAIRTYEAASGSEAMGVLSKMHVDCVLLDQSMPGGSGLEWMGRMLELNPDLAIVFVTGAGNEEIAVAALRSGATDYLVKGTDSLMQGVKRAILSAFERTDLRNTVEVQRLELVEAERHRAMIASLGAACHHLGQPATVLGTNLALLRKAADSESALELIDKCIEASRAISDVLNRLQKVSHFRTEPYRPGGDDDDERPSGEHILKI